MREESWSRRGALNISSPPSSFIFTAHIQILKTHQKSFLFLFLIQILNSVCRFKFTRFSQRCFFFVNLSDFASVNTLHDCDWNKYRKWCSKNNRKMGQKSFSCEHTKFFRIVTDTIIVTISNVSNLLCSSMASRRVLVIHYVVACFCHCFWDDYCFSKDTYTENAWYAHWIFFYTNILTFLTQ